MSLFSGTRIYTVHVRPDLIDPFEKPVFVREGFNVFAFLFTFLWALSQRLWMTTILILGVHMLLVVLDQQGILSNAGVGVVQLGFQVLVGFHANDWRRAGLARRGYIMSDVASGNNLLGAEQRYFERYLAHA